jgi:hypothetical protein
MGFQRLFVVENVAHHHVLISEAFLKAKTKGTVAIEIAAETTNAKPLNPAETPREKAVAANTGAAVCANPAIAHATPKAPP